MDHKDLPTEVFLERLKKISLFSYEVRWICRWIDMIVTDCDKLSQFVSSQEGNHAAVIVYLHSIAVQLFFLSCFTVFIQVVECIAESLSILETPLQVKVRRAITISFRRLCFFCDLLPVDWLLF